MRIRGPCDNLRNLETLKSSCDKLNGLPVLAFCGAVNRPLHRRAGASFLENRSAQHHKDRLLEAIKEELVIIVTGELSDPRVGLVTVHEVAMASGGKSARIYVGVAGTPAEQKESITALNDAIGFIRHQLADSLGLRVAPDLHFVLDTSGQYGSRIDQLLTRIDKRSKKKKTP
jgi:ribosome-binding factor A